MKIVILQPLETDISFYLNNDIFKKHQIFEYKTKTNDEDELVNRISDADIVISDNTPLTKEILSKNPHLKALFIAFSGLDHIDLNYCNENKIQVFNASGYSTNAVAELTLMFILMSLRKFNELNYKHKTIGRELTNMKIGLVGIGNISKEVIHLLSVFNNLEILYYSKSRHLEIENEKIKFKSKKDLLKESDIISLHVPLNEKTTNFLDEYEFSLMKKGVILINTARGKLISKESLLKALKDNKISLYLSDVFEIEPPLDDNYDLLQFKNVIITPHIGFYTKEAMEKRVKIIFEKLSTFLISY